MLGAKCLTFLSPLGYLSEKNHNIKDWARKLLPSQFSFLAAGLCVTSKMPACIPAVSVDALIADCIAGNFQATIVLSFNSFSSLREIPSRVSKD